MNISLSIEIKDNKSLLYILKLRASGSIQIVTTIDYLKHNLCKIYCNLQYSYFRVAPWLNRSLVFAVLCQSYLRIKSDDQIWMNLQEVFNVITQTAFSLDNLTPLNFHIPTQYENFTEIIALLLTATNYCIWQRRLGRLNTELQNSKSVNHKLVLAKIFNHISIREKKEEKHYDLIFIVTINIIKHTIA